MESQRLMGKTKRDVMAVGLGTKQKIRLGPAYTNTVIFVN